MALSRELTRRLDIEDEPLAKRSKLAENAFTTMNVAVTRKEDLVLEWLCKMLENRADDNKVIWNSLHYCLKYRNLSNNIVLKFGIKELLVQTLIKKLNGIAKSELENVLQCLELIFSSCKMQQYFQSKPECLVQLIKALIESVYDLSKAEISGKCDFTVGKTSISEVLNPEIVSARKCAARAVDCFVTCYKQSVNKDEFADLLIRALLYPLCSLIDTSGSDKLGAEIHKCIQQLIFSKSRYSHWKTFNGKEENFSSKVLGELKKKAETADEHITLVAFFYVFRAAVGSYKNDPAIIDIIFRNIVDSAGRVKVALIGCLRQHLANITFDYHNKIEDLTLFEYLQKVIDEILLSDRLGSTDLDALTSIAVLNPLIIQTKLQHVLNKVLLEERETTNERDSYRNFMITILDTEIRLKSEQKIVPWILTAIKIVLNDRENCNLKMDDVFPNEFRDQLTKAVTNMTSMQMIGVFRSLTFHLQSLCNESSQTSKSAQTFMLQANVDLMTAFFRGVRVFEHSVPLTAQEKFAQALDDLGKTIESLTEIVLTTKHNKEMITALLTVVWYWDNMYNWLKYYAPDAMSKTLDFPISQAQTQRLVQSIDSSRNKEAMNRILVQRMGRYLQEGTSLDVSNLIGGFDKSWSFIVDRNPQTISFMNNSQVAEIAHLLLADAKSSGSMKRLSSESVQNNERLVKAVVCQTFVDIAMNINQSNTKNIVEHVNVVKMLDRGKVSKLLKQVANVFDNKNEWTHIDSESVSVIQDNLQVLLHLPLAHSAQDLRTFILLVVYAIKKESQQSIETCDLCAQIILDVLEKSDVEIIHYVDASCLVHELPRNRDMQRAVESSLRKVHSWETVKALIKNTEINDESIVALLECVERTRTKSSLKNDQKKLLNKAQQKLSKKLLDGVEAEIRDQKQVKRLSMALAAISAATEIPENLVNLTNSTLDRIFLSKALQDDEFVVEALQLVKVVLKKRSKFEMSQEVVENVWPLVIKNPSKELVGLLLQTTQAKPLNRMLQLLHKQTISGLDESNNSRFANALIIWDSVTNASMNAFSDKFRIAAIINVLEALQVSKIPSKCWPDVLRLIRSIFAKHSHAIEKGIDVILMLAARSLREFELSACEDVLAICYHLIKFKSDFIVDRLPVLLAMYRQLVRLVVRESRKQLVSSEEQKLGCLALDIAKFTNSLVKLKKEMARISPYVIADLVEIFSEGVIPFYVKGPLEDSVGHFLSICDHHAVSLLSRALPTAIQEIFKKIYENYKQFYKYTGRI